MFLSDVSALQPLSIRLEVVVDAALHHNVCALITVLPQKTESEQKDVRIRISTQTAQSRVSLNFTKPPVGLFA